MKRKTKKKGELVPPAESLTETKLNELMVQAKSGDSKANKDLREIFRGRPELAAQVRELGVQTQRHIAGQLLEGNQAARELLEEKTSSLRDELAGPSPSAVELVLSERAATIWLALQVAENHSAQCKDLRAVEFWDKQVDRRQRQLIETTKALATIRRTLAPRVLQVNVAESQQIAQVLKP